VFGWAVTFEKTVVGCGCWKSSFDKTVVGWLGDRLVELLSTFPYKQTPHVIHYLNLITSGPYMSCSQNLSSTSHHKEKRRALLVAHGGRWELGPLQVVGRRRRLGGARGLADLARWRGETEGFARAPTLGFAGGLPLRTGASEDRWMVAPHCDE
jgi:hypothetical protein